MRKPTISIVLLLMLAILSGLRGSDRSPAVPSVIIAEHQAATLHQHDGHARSRGDARHACDASMQTLMPNGVGNRMRVQAPVVSDGRFREQDGYDAHTASGRTARALSSIRQIIMITGGPERPPRNILA